uniref:Uncharacterized protein n=1 Tax=Hordeum vulgare subsp. vulgare TaxID=112509 RepID=A0A8I7BBC8_HORVV
MDASLAFKDNLMSTFANVLPVQIINGIFESTHSLNTKQCSLQNVQEETTLSVLKFLSEYKRSSLFSVAGEENFQKTGSTFKESTSILIEKGKTHCERSSAAAVGMHTKIDEKLKKGSIVIKDILPESNNDFAPSATTSKRQPAQASNKFTSLELIIGSRLSTVEKNLHDATGYHAATPECVITKL